MQRGPLSDKLNDQPYERAIVANKKRQLLRTIGNVRTALVKDYRQWFDVVGQQTSDARGQQRGGDGWGTKGGGRQELRQGQWLQTKGGGNGR